MHGNSNIKKKPVSRVKIVNEKHGPVQDKSHFREHKFT
jgi:hypothetical protein